MRHLNKFFPLAALLVSVAAWAQAPVDAQATLNERLAGIKSLSAAFTQTTINSSNRTLQQSSGKLWVARPSRFRIETTSPSVQTLVSDGTDFWTWDADLEQVIIKKLDKDVKQVPILLLGGDTDRITRQYQVRRYEDKEGEHFVLTAQSNTSLFETLGMDFQHGQPAAISITDSLGQQTRITLDHVVINQPIAESRFEFAPPKGADVIDDRDAH